MHRQRLMGLIGALGLAMVSATAEARPSWPIIKEFGGATAKNEASWIKPDDYPSNALTRGLQGNVVVAFEITIEGRAKNCSVEQTSGQPSLDRVPCRLIENRARFLPARNASGNPAVARGRYSVAFWLPE